MLEDVTQLRKALNWTFFTMLGLIVIFIALFPFLAMSMLTNGYAAKTSQILTNMATLIIFVLAVFNIILSIIYLKKSEKKTFGIIVIIISAIAIITFVLIILLNFLSSPH